MSRTIQPYIPQPALNETFGINRCEDNEYELQQNDDELLEDELGDFLVTTKERYLARRVRDLDRECGMLKIKLHKAESAGVCSEARISQLSDELVDAQEENERCRQGPEAIVDCRTDKFLSTRFFKLLSIGWHPDLAIKCQDTTVKVHGAIIGSELFAFKIHGRSLEVENGVINMDGDDPDSVARLVQFLYTLSYDESDICSNRIDQPTTWMIDFSRSRLIGIRLSQSHNPSFENAPSKALVTNMQVYLIAAKYEFTPLMDFAFAKYERILHRYSDTGHFLESIRLLYNHDSSKTIQHRQIKDLILSIMCHYATEFYNDADFVEMMQKNVEIGIDLLRFCGENE